MKLFVFGYYGCGNLGDEAILKSFIDWARQELPGVEFVVQTSDVEHTRAQFDVAAAHKYGMAAMLRGLRGCDAVVAPGGGLLQDATSAKSLMYYLGLIWLARFLRKPVYLLSQGVGPLRRPWLLRGAARALRRCRHVAVRDAESLELVQSLGVPEDVVKRSGDLVLLGALPEHEGYAFEDGRRLRVGLSLRPTAELGAAVNVLLGCLLRLNEKRPLELRLFPLCRDEDLPLLDDFAARVKQRAPAIEVRMVSAPKGGPLGVADMERAVSELDAMVGMRLHSLVFAARGAVPFLGLSYDPKVAAFSHACGMPVIEKLGAAEPLDVMRKLEQALDCPAETRAAMRDALHGMRRALLGDMDLFLRLLSKDVQGPRRILGVPVSRLSFDHTIRYLTRTARSDGKAHVITVNPEMLLHARRHAGFRNILKSAELNTADGVGVRLAFRIKYGRRIEKVAGVDMLERLLRESAEHNIGLYMLGAKPEIIEKAVQRARAMSPPPQISGFHHGYLRDVDQEQLIKNINESGAQILFVGMGSPAQEEWIHKHRARLTPAVLMGVGGSFDVLAGAARRAPKWMRAAGLEWLHRIAREPKRIPRIAGFPFFIILVLYESVIERFRNK